MVAQAGLPAGQFTSTGAPAAPQAGTGVGMNGLDLGDNGTKQQTIGFFSRLLME